MPQEVHKILNRFGHFANEIDDRCIRVIYSGKNSAGNYVSPPVAKYYNYFPNNYPYPNLLKEIGFYIDMMYIFTTNDSTSGNVIEINNGRSALILIAGLPNNGVWNWAPIHSEKLDIISSLNTDKYCIIEFAIRYIPKEFYRPSSFESTKPMTISSSEPEQKSSKLPSLGE